MNRRSVMKGAAALSLVGIPVVAESAPTQSHVLFATHHIEDAVWQDFGDKTAWSIDADVIEKARMEKGIDLETEVRAALERVTISGIETIYLNELRTRPTAAIWDIDNVEVSDSVGDLHGTFGNMLLRVSRAGPDSPQANTVVVGMTALTILQSSTSRNFQRHHIVRPSGFLASLGTLSSVGTLSDETVTLNVLCDLYGSDKVPTLVGYVPPDPIDRKAAMIRHTTGRYTFGFSPGYEDGWRTVGIRIETLRFI